MKTPLLDISLHYAESHADKLGVAATPVSGLSLIRSVRPSEIQYAISKPLVALVLQGSKHVRTGSEVFDFGAGDSLIISADVPTASRITEASVAQPYCSFVLELDQAIVTELTVDMNALPDAYSSPIRVEPTDEEVADAALRIMKLLARPASLPILGPQMMREIHYWLLAGRHGPAIRRLGWPNGRTQKIGRAVAILRRDFAQPLRVEALAEAAGMSPSSFHQHFKTITSLSPLQFQKQLRLIEARRLMLAQECSPGVAAFSVGYESVTQFTREYARMFGLPPVRETRAARALVQAA